MGRPKSVVDLVLLKKYYLADFNVTKLEESFGLNRRTLARRLSEIGIYRPVKNKQLNLSPNDFFMFRSIVDGILLSDGHVDRFNILQLFQAQPTTEWLAQIKFLLSNLGVESKLYEYPSKASDFGNGKISISKVGQRLSSRAYNEFKVERNRWYKNNIKHLPKDILINPLSVAFWFCGDGSYDETGRLSFGTCAFKKTEVEFLIQKFENVFNIAPTYSTTKNNYNIIQISKIDDAFNLSMRVLPFIPKCFRYKFRYVRNKQHL